MDRAVFINGSWREGRGESLVALTPATQQPHWQGRAADAADVNEAVAAARAAFPAWARLSREERRKFVLSYRAVVEHNRAQLAEIIHRDTGKPLWEAETEAATVVGKIALSIQAEDERCPEKSSGEQVRAVLRHRPHGVVAVFGPYNFPAHLPNGHIVPALLAGNTVVFKPSELTPGSAEAMVRYWDAAGLPSGVLNLVQGGRETGMALGGHADIDGIFFTGSATTGKLLNRQNADKPGRILALEMGGNNALVVWRPKDKEGAVRTVIQSAFISAGQRCTCARRLVLPDNAWGRGFLAELKDFAQRIVTGPQNAEVQFMGPVITNAAADHLMAAQEKLISSGAEAVLTMARPDAGLPFLTPGILDVTKAKGRTDEEFFGPLLQVVFVSDFDAALAEVNNTSFGLAAGLIADDAMLWQDFALRAKGGVVNWNRPLTGASGALPFGGIGDSGNHRPAGYYSADYCSYPVASLEADALDGAPMQGIRT